MIFGIVSMTRSKTTTKLGMKDAVSADAVEHVLPSLSELLEAGVHFGHERSKRNPKMAKYVFMQRQRVAIIDLEKTLEKLRNAVAFVHDLATTPGNDILFVGTKRQARAIIQKYAQASGQPYVTKRWLGGTITNFSTILKSIEKLDELKRTEHSPAVMSLTKKEKSVRGKEIGRLENVLEGIKHMRKLPAALFIVGVHDEPTAVREASRVGIPVVGIVDTDADPDSVGYEIPGNDDAIRSINLVTSVIASAILSARGKTPDEIQKAFGTKSEEGRVEHTEQVEPVTLHDSTA